MRTLTVIPQRRGESKRIQQDGPPPQQHQHRHGPAKTWGLLGRRIRRAFTPLIDAKTASQLLGVPHTWLLAQARANTIPHHRLGHYVRFNPDDLQAWLTETRSGPQDHSRPQLSAQRSIRHVA